MPSLVQSWIVPILAFAGGAVFNFALSEWSKNRDREGAERSRRLDLYKTVYPEKFKAARDLMEKASAVFVDLHNFRSSLTEEGRKPLLAKNKDLFLLAHSLVWLLGSEVEQSARIFELAVESAVSKREERDIPDEAMLPVKPALEALAQSIRKHLHIQQFDKLFSV